MYLCSRYVNHVAATTFTKTNTYNNEENTTDRIAIPSRRA